MQMLVVWIGTGVDTFTLFLGPDTALEYQVLNAWVFL
jgi:hypothetical protein